MSDDTARPTDGFRFTQPILLPSRHWYFLHLLGHVIALSHGRAIGDRYVPAFDVGELVEIDGLPFEARNPRPDRNVGHRIVVGNEFMVGKPTIEDAIEAHGFFEIARLGIGRLTLV